MKWFFFFCSISLLFAEDITTIHTLPLSTGTLNYKATVGHIPIQNSEDAEVAKMGYISYEVEGVQGKRPILFAFNGGPGSSSVWLHLGMLGPKRVVSYEDGGSAVPPYEIVDCEETLLDSVDLVFVDPVGTGFSEKSKETESDFYDLSKDIESVSMFIRNYLTTHSKWNSPIYLAGESYGTLRACGVTNHLQQHGIAVTGVILISCAIDYQAFCLTSNNPLPYLLYFPTYLTTSWYHERSLLNAFPNLTIEEVANKGREFAYKKLLPYLIRPDGFKLEKETLFQEIAGLTGMPIQFVTKMDGKIDPYFFVTEFFPSEKKRLGRFDTRCIGRYVTFSDSWIDPSLTAIESPFTTALQSYLQSDLNCPKNYKIFSYNAIDEWNFQVPKWGGYPNLMNELKMAMFDNPTLKVFVGSGYFDAATPFAATEYCFETMGLLGPDFPQLSLRCYEGGHMFYLNEKARVQFKQDLMQHFKDFR